MSMLFDFTVDKAAKTIHVTREFAADLNLVWDAYTKAEILDQWVAPKPWRARTREMEFREGGRWLYAMVSPEDVHHWSVANFIKIQPKSGFSSKNFFSDENGNPINNASSLTINSFKEGKQTTTVYTEKKFEDMAVLEMMIAKGFKEGTAAGLANLDEYLLTQTTNKKNPEL